MPVRSSCYTISTLDFALILDVIKMKETGRLRQPPPRFNPAMDIRASQVRIGSLGLRFGLDVQVGLKLGSGLELPLNVTASPTITLTINITRT